MVQPIAGEPASTRPVRVMLVEDDFLIRLTLSEVLSDQGIEVVEADSGDAALAMLREQPGIAVLLTDIQLPGGLDGKALADEARKLLPELPIIFMTGRPDTANSRPPSPNEIFVAKPYLPSDICLAIDRILARAGA